MSLSIIVATGENNEIGCRNNLLWHLPADLRRFRQLTTGHVVVMGRKTFESLPKGPLPDRTNVIISRNPEFSHADCLVFPSLDEAMIKLSGDRNVYIIGGGQIYRQALPYATMLYLTKVHASFPEADTFFPEIDPTKWAKMSEETHPANEKNCYSFTFFEYKRITY